MSTTNDPSQVRAGRKEWLGLGLLVLPSLLLFMMLTILFLAIPHIAVDLRPSSTQMLWIVDIYGFLMAGFLVAMGTLGDRVGRRLVFTAGSAVFAVVSLVAAYTGDPGWMIFWRAVLGVAAAAVMPATLGLIFSMFLNPKQRGIAIGAWAASISVGVALGPLLSGVLIEVFDWRATFLVAVPVMAIVAVGAPFVLPEHKDGNAGKLDLFSVGLLLATLLPLIYGVKTLAKDDSGVVAVGAIAVGVAFGVWFVLRQLRSSAPLLDVRLFANRTVSGALSVYVLAALAMGGMYLMFTRYLQLVADLSPMQTGFAILPAALVLVGVSMFSPILARRVRPGYIITGGFAVQVVGYLMLTQVSADAGATAGLPLLLAGFIVLYPAVNPAMALTTGLVVGSVPPEKAGAASGLSTTANDLGLSLGVALIGSIGVAAYRNDITLPGGLPADVAASARESLDGAVSAAQGLPAEVANTVLEPARAAFTSGLNLSALIAAVIAVAGAVLAAVRLKHVPATGAAAHDEPEKSTVDA